MDSDCCKEKGGRPVRSHLELLPHQMDPQLQYLHHARIVNAAERLRLGEQGLFLLASRSCLFRLLLILASEMAGDEATAQESSPVRASTEPGPITHLELPVLSPQELLILEGTQRLPQHMWIDLQVHCQLVLLYTQSRDLTSATQQ